MFGAKIPHRSHNDFNVILLQCQILTLSHISVNLQSFVGGNKLGNKKIGSCEVDGAQVDSAERLTTCQARSADWAISN